MNTHQLHQVMTALDQTVPGYRADLIWSTIITSGALFILGVVVFSLGVAGYTGWRHKAQGFKALVSVLAPVLVVIGLLAMLFNLDWITPAFWPDRFVVDHFFNQYYQR